MFEIRKLRAGYGSAEILRGVSLKVGPGDIVAIVGPNGSGKTTIFKSIFNLCTIRSGKILFRGKNITKIPTHLLAKEGIGYVQQGRQVFGDMSVIENLEMGGFLLNDRKKILKTIKEILVEFPFLDKRKDDYASSLSGGQQQILSISMALMLHPSLLLLDEPSLGLAPRMTDRIFGIIKELNKEGITMMIVEQNVKKAIEVADRTYVMYNGHASLIGNSKIQNSKKMLPLFFGGV